MSSLADTWGVTMLGMLISGVLYGITCAQMFFYYRVYHKDPLYVRILTGSAFVLNTIHVGLSAHIPWYYLVDGAGGKYDDVIVWSWAVNALITVFTSLPLYSFYIRRIRVLGGPIWLCTIVGLFACAHFVLSCVVGVGALLDNQWFTFTTNKLTIRCYYASAGFGAVTDAAIAMILCRQLYKARTGFKNTDSTITILMTYTINTGLLTALDVMAGLICVLVAPRTQIGNFFMLILPDLYVNSYLGSLNTRSFIRLARAKSEDDSRHAISMSTRAPATNIHVERTTLRTIDNTSLHKGGRANDHAAAVIDVSHQFDKTSLGELRDDAKRADLEAV